MASELDRHKRWLVERAEQDLDQAGVQRGGSRHASQLRNLVQMTQTETDVRVLANFIHYQAARPASQGLWRGLHPKVIGSLGEIEKRIQDAEIRRVAIQHYFGYLTRHYVYLSSVGQSDSQSDKKKGAAR